MYFAPFRDWKYAWKGTNFARCVKLSNETFNRVTLNSVPNHVWNISWFKNSFFFLWQNLFHFPFPSWCLPNASCSIRQSYRRDITTLWMLKGRLTFLYICTCKYYSQILAILRAMKNFWYIWWYDGTSNPQFKRRFFFFLD